MPRRYFRSRGRPLASLLNSDVPPIAEVATTTAKVLHPDKGREKDGKGEQETLYLNLISLVLKNFVHSAGRAARVAIPTVMTQFRRALERQHLIKA